MVDAKTAAGGRKTPHGRENRAVQDEHQVAADVARVHAHFSAKHFEAYGLRYERELLTALHEWRIASEFVERHGLDAAKVLIGRAFADPLLSRFGLDLGLVALYAADLEWSPRPNGSRLAPAHARLVQVALAKREGRDYPAHIAWLATRSPAQLATYLEAG